MRRKLILGLAVVAALLVVTLTTRQFGSTPAEAQGLNVTVSLSKPANGSFFAKGEKAVVTVSLNDKSGVALKREDFSALNLYMYGPQETTKTVTPKMLGAETDRTKTPHHYINLLTNTAVQVSGNVLKYTLQPVTDEEPGTYTASLRASLSGTPTRENRMFALADFQVGTATAEKQLVEKEKCAACHLGAANGQFYFAHVDRTGTGFGNPDIEMIPVRTCKSCHNNEGYAAYRGDVDNPGAGTSTRTPDPIVRRVHGVHMGEGLKTAFNNDPTTGNFADYIHVKFPADVRNCTACHVDDRWKTKPSRQACTACHDSVWFGDAASMPKDRKAHPGGPQANDLACAACHTAEGGNLSVTGAHKVEPPPFKHEVEITMSQPANGKFFVAGEMPQVGIVVKDRATGLPINPNTIREPADPTKAQPGEFRRANLYVSGPRAETKPVLTSARALTTTFYANNDLRVLRDASKADRRLTRSDTKLTYQLDDVKGLKPGTYQAFVETLPAPPNIGGWALFSFQVGTETPEKTVATNCKDCHGNTTMHTSFFAVEFNPDICKNCHDYQRQIPGKSGWTDSNNGFGAGPLSRRVHGVHFGRYLDKPKEVHATVNYSEVIFPQDVRNCTKCHSETTTWAEKPSRVACLACHDTDVAIGHAQQQTVNNTPNEPYSGQQTETCKVCHGKDKEFSPDKMHNISNPYKPPYPREPVR